MHPRCNTMSSPAHSPSQGGGDGHGDGGGGHGGDGGGGRGGGGLFVFLLLLQNYFRFIPCVASCGCNCHRFCVAASVDLPYRL
jgi:hypothetical protein